MDKSQPASGHNHHDTIPAAAERESHPEQDKPEEKQGEAQLMNKNQNSGTELESPAMPSSVDDHMPPEDEYDTTDEAPEQIVISDEQIQEMTRKMQAMIEQRSDAITTSTGNRIILTGPATVLVGNVIEGSDSNASNSRSQAWEANAQRTGNMRNVYVGDVTGGEFHRFLNRDQDRSSGA